FAKGNSLWKHMKTDINYYNGQEHMEHDKSEQYFQVNSYTYTKAKQNPQISPLRPLKKDLFKVSDVGDITILSGNRLMNIENMMSTFSSVYSDHLSSSPKCQPSFAVPAESEKQKDLAFSIS
ncbi:unnamed protein product, partial [Owenia fusiformis]